MSLQTSTLHSRRERFLRLQRPPEAPGEGVTHGMVRDAIVAMMRVSQRYGGTVDVAMADQIAGRIHPGIAAALGTHAPADLTGNDTFKLALSHHLNLAAATLPEGQRQALQHTLQHANEHGADFTAALAGIRLAALGPGGLRLSGAAGRAVDAHERGSSADYSRAFPISWNPTNLTSDMRSYVDEGRGITASHVAQAANYASTIGLNPQQYAGYFVGSSATVRSAIRSHIETGARVTDDHIQRPQDVAAVIGAIRSGRMRAEDAPPSVRRVIEDMRRRGLDPATADPRQIQQYFKDNPQALAAAKAANAQDIAARAGVDQTQLDAESRRLEQLRGAPPTAPTASAPANPTASAPINSASPAASAAAPLASRPVTASGPATPATPQAHVNASPPGRTARLNLG